jgi:hypothetical protein
MPKPADPYKELLDLTRQIDHTIIAMEKARNFGNRALRDAQGLVVRARFGDKLSAEQEAIAQDMLRDAAERAQQRGLEKGRVELAALSTKLESLRTQLPDVAARAAVYLSISVREARDGR